MSNNRHRVSLKQLTPIIHFQHKQHGATLRASEVRPKLDRFLTEKFADINQSGKDFSPEIALIKKTMDEKLPAPYKLKVIVPQPNPDYYFFDSHIKNDDKRNLKRSLDLEFELSVQLIAPSPYFANQDKHKNGRLEQGKKEEIRLGMMAKDSIVLEVFSLNSNMVELVKEALPAFFMTHNFGSRQSKGFGCYELEMEHFYNLEKVLGAYFDAGLRYSKIIQTNRVQNLFKLIDTTYKQIKNNTASGESLIRDYFEDQEGIYWEKKLITPVLVNDQPIDVEINRDQIHYVRALLGLAELHDYPQSPEKPKVNISDTLGEVGRFASPLLFKVYDNHLYLLAKEIDGKMFNRSFDFYIGKNKEEAEQNNQLEKLTTPTAEQFDIADFIKNYLNLTNWNTF